MANANKKPRTLQPSSANFHFEVPNVSEMDEVYSGEVLVQGIPWKIKFCKMVLKEKPRFAVYLQCAKKNIRQNWTVPASVSIKLLSFNGDDNAIEVDVWPHVFDNSTMLHGETIIDWCDLLDDSKRYVKDNKIVVDVKIIAENPDQRNKAVENFQNIEQICENCGIATFCVAIKNIENLMAVRTSALKLRGIDFHLTISKNQSKYLGLKIHSKSAAGKFAFEMKSRVKLISSKLRDKSFEKSYNGCITETLDFVCDLISWDELTDRENGYIENDSIIAKFRINVEDPKDKAPGSEKCKAVSEPSKVKRAKLECDVCQQSSANQGFFYTDFAYTTCGHLLCTKCIADSMKKKKCGFCNVKINSDKTGFAPI